MMILVTPKHLFIGLFSLFIIVFLVIVFTGFIYSPFDGSIVGTLLGLLIIALIFSVYYLIWYQSKKNIINFIQ